MYSSWRLLNEVEVRSDAIYLVTSWRDKYVPLFTFRKNQARARCNLSSHDLRGGFSFFPK